MKRKHLYHWILVIIAVLSLIELLFNGSILFTTNSKAIQWNSPEMALENNDGALCIVDNEWRRVIILNPDRTVRSIISTGFFSSVSPHLIVYAAFNNDYVFIADKIMSENGTYILSERVLKYDLDGNYISTPYSEDAPPNNFHGDMQDVTVYNDTLFVAKVIDDQVLVFRIDENKAEKDTIIQYSFQGNPVQYATYQPEINTLTISTLNGKSFIYRDGICSRVKLADKKGHIACVVVANDGTRYILDSNNSLLIMQEQDLTESTVCSTDGLFLCHNPNSSGIRRLLVCEESNNAVAVISVPENNVSFITEGKVSSKHIFKWYLTKVSLIVLILILLYFLVNFNWKRLANHFSSLGSNPIKEKERSISLSELYGRPAVLMLISFLATGLYLSITLYKSKMDNAISQANIIATSISTLSDETIGDAVGRITSADDYGSPDYLYVTNFCNSLCNGGQSEGFDLAYRLFRFDTETGEPIYIFDYLAINVCGQKVSKKRMIHTGTYGFINSVLNGNIETYEYKTKTGVDIYYSMSPLFNSSGKITGAVLISIDMKAVSSATIGTITSLLLKIVTLLSIILLVFVELRLLRGFLRIRKNRMAIFGKDITICEGHRTLKILSNIPIFLLIPFISPYAKELAAESGITGDPGFLSALPLSVSGLTLAVTSLFASIYTKRNPKRYLQMCNIVKIVLTLILLLNIHLRNFYLLVAVFIVFGLTSSIASACHKAIRFCDLKPDKKYDKLVFTNLESSISVSIGTALGALVYDSLGHSAVLVISIIVSLITMVLTKMFLGPDINISKEKELEIKQSDRMADTKTSIDLIMRYLHRPDVIGCLLFVAIPLSFFNPFSSYMLPMLNESTGYPVLTVGFLTLLTKTLSMIISPSIISIMKGVDFSPTFLICMVSVAFVLFSFAYQPTMFFFSIVLFTMGILSPVLNTRIEQFQIASAKSGKIIPNDVHGVFSLANYTGDFAGPVSIAALMSIGNAATGFISGAGCLMCAVGTFLTFRKKTNPVIQSPVNTLK